MKRDRKRFLSHLLRDYDLAAFNFRSDNMRYTLYFNAVPPAASNGRIQLQPEI